MARKEYPFKLTNNLDKYLRIKQANLTIERGKTVTMKQLHKEMSDFMGVSENAITLIKGNNYNPSLVVAMSMAKFLDTPVEKLFSIERKETGDN